MTVRFGLPTASRIVRRPAASAVAALLSALAPTGPAHGELSAFSTLASSCVTPVRLTRLTPALCYHNFDALSCTDTCQQTTPELSPACFTTLDLPCELQTESTKPLPPSGSPALPILQVLQHPALRSSLYVFQASLYQDLLGHFVAPASHSTFGLAQATLTKEDYRLELMQRLLDATRPLATAASDRAFSLARALETSTTQHAERIISLSRESPLHDAAEREELSKELKALLEPLLGGWTRLRSLPPERVWAARAALLNRKLERFVADTAALPESRRSQMLARSARLDRWIPVNVRACSPGPLCYFPVASTGPGPSTAADLVFERLLDGLQEELGIAASDQTVSGEQAPSTVRLPADLQRPLTQYVDSPEQADLRRFEVALAVATGARRAGGDDPLETLSGGAEAPLAGDVSVSALPERAFLSCATLGRVEPRLQAIASELRSLAAELQAALAASPGSDARSRVSGLRALAAHVDDLRGEALALSRADRFSPDREQRLLWILNQDLFDIPTSISIEYIAVRGLYWLPPMAIALQELLPSVRELRTLQGSLLPGAHGSSAGASLLELTLSESPQLACQADQTVQIVLRQDGPSGTRRRLLTADLTSPWNSL